MTVSSIQKKFSFKPSDEQEAIRVCDSDGIKINACAGSGKTQTLIIYSDDRPHKKFLFLAYNNAIAAEASSRFPENVTCKTTHGLAYEEFGHVYETVGKLGEPDLRAICTTLFVRHIHALCIARTIANYCGSDDKDIDVKHIDIGLAKRIGVIDAAGYSDLVIMANNLWMMMKNVNIKEIKIPHDGYLKLYALSEPRLDLNYDGILIDEGQDSSGAVSGMLTRQKCQKIIVGDRHQAINSWRGAVNAMETFPCDSNFSLTKSFRYGGSIANVANKILDLKGEKTRIEGTDKGIKNYETPAIICRKNSSVFENILRIAEDGKKVFLIGGFNSYRFNKILDVYNLAFASVVNINDPLIGSFNNFDDLQEYSIKSEDGELGQLCGIVNEYGERVPQMIELCRAHTVEYVNYAHVVLGTAHRTKGMEFSFVALENDFIDLAKVDKSKIESKTEEINLAYVACTRAKHTLFTSEKIGTWLDNYELSN